MTGEPTPFARFRALVPGDAALQDILSRIDDDDAFVSSVVTCAGVRGIAVAPDEVRTAMRPDSLGMSRWTAAPVQASDWPGASWLPVHVSNAAGQVDVDWAHFGGRRLTEPFFEDSIRRALARPFNRLFRTRMTFDDFLHRAPRSQVVQPRGLIFHMSRCGSTLVTQMLAVVSANVVISEAPPIDAVVQLGRALGDAPGDRAVLGLASMIGALGQPRHGDERHLFVKLDCWHALALPLFRRTFPSVPWVFLYRDPIEVLVSQMRARGSQMVPELVPPGVYGLENDRGVSDADYCARVLAKICGAALDAWDTGGGCLINYRDLPDAVWTNILPHFGVACSDGERAAMTAAARDDAKRPGLEFSRDSEDKQREATAALRVAATRHLADVHRRLEDLRGSVRT